MIAPSLTPRQKATIWAAEVLADPSSCFLDCETTGLGPEAEIVDIAIVDIDGRVLLNSLVCPLRSIPPEATAVHGIRERDVHKAPMFRELWPKINKVISYRRVVVYNADYDSGVIAGLLRAEKIAGLHSMAYGWQCAMKRYSDYNGTIDTRFSVRPSRWGPHRTEPRMKWWHLSDACTALGVEANGFHRALSDAETCRLVVRAMAASSPVPSAPTAAKEPTS